MLLLSIGTFAQSTTQKQKLSKKELRGALRPERTCFDVTYYHLHLKIMPNKRTIEGYNDIHFKVVAPTQKIQIDLFKNMHIDTVLYQEKALTFEREHNAVWVYFEEVLPTGILQSIRVHYRGKPAVGLGTFGDRDFQWNKDKKGRPWVGVSCEHIGASLWYPNKDHLSDEPDSVRMNYLVPSELRYLANGKLEHKQVVSEQLAEYQWFTRYPINNYNVTFYLGHHEKTIIPYKNTKGEQEVAFYSLDYDTKWVASYTAYLPIMIRYFERLFGQYPFWDDKLAIVQGGYRGREHQTCLNIGKVLERNNWAYPIDVAWDATLAHELAHEWWGNAISVNDMADAWLHEGFATYCEALLIESIYGTEAYNKIISSFRRYSKQNTIVGKRDINYNSFRDSNIYFKGAVVIHELREEIADDRLFFALLSGFQLRYKYQTVTTQDFIETVNTVTGKDYTDFLKKRLY
ncbi:MAG: M1 family metallopeptidase [Bacteroidota bacterium]